MVLLTTIVAMLLYTSAIPRDTNRQAAIDIMHGLEPDLAEIREEKSEVSMIPIHNTHTIFHHIVVKQYRNLAALGNLNEVLNSI